MNTKKYYISCLFTILLISQTTTSFATNENKIPTKDGKVSIPFKTEGGLLVKENLEITTKEEIKKIRSKLLEIPQDKINLHRNSLLGSTTIITVENLIKTSEKTEASLLRISTYLDTKETDTKNTKKIPEARVKLEEAKVKLNSANISISALSNMIETWSLENSTTTYKKSVLLKKNDFKLSAESAKKNIKSANNLAREALILSKTEKDTSTSTELLETISTTTIPSPLSLDLTSPIKK